MPPPTPYTYSMVQLGVTWALSAHGLHLSYQNTTRLQRYEHKSEKAAKWSNTAARKLHNTRTTQASGIMALLLSFLTSAMLVLVPRLASPTALIAAGVANSTALYLSRVYMASFWTNGKQNTRVPFVVEQFNEAVRGSEQVVVLLGTLSLAWGVATGLTWAAAMANRPLGVLGLAVWALVMGGRITFVAPQMGWSFRL